MSIALMVSIGSMQAQVENRALNFSAEGTVDCGIMPAIDKLSSYSLQFWLNPDSWKEGAAILSRGNDFSVNLGTPGEIQFKIGGSEVKASSDDLKAADWNQVTMICDSGNAKVLVNGKEAGEGSLNMIPQSDEPVMIGGGYTGMIDEIRIWDAALNDEMKTFDYFTHNTLNKWNPMWENLAAYYKMDQKDCPYLVDYKGIEDKLKGYDNHGVMTEGVVRVSANNAKMPYLVNSAYTNNPRFYDRIIPRDQYLLSNDLIILGVDVFASDGHLETKTPNYHAEVSGGKYLESFEGRSGVLECDGNTKLTLPSKALQPTANYSFETWLYLDEWTPGAYLFRKESDDQQKGLAIYLGDDASNPTLIVRTDGKRIQSKTLEIPMKEWIHVGVSSNNGGNISQAFIFVVNGKNYYGDTASSDDSPNVLPSGNKDLPGYIGENLKGKIDDTCLWNRKWSAADMKNHMTYIPMPATNRNVSVSDMDVVVAFYRYDNSDNLGHSSHSQDEWLNIMKGAYEGHAGVSFYISVQGYYTARDPYGNWRNILADAKKRAKFVEDLVEISKPYDGVELDLEWIEGGATQWNNYALLCDEIEEALPEGKKFRISLHNSYTNFPVDHRDKYDGFTFQQYGPQSSHYYYTSFTSFVQNSFIGKNYPREKIMTSYSTTTSNATDGGDITGVRRGALDDYVPAPVSSRDFDKWTDPSNGKTYFYMGPMQVYARAKYTREQNLQGIFYWDMGNDGWKGTAANPTMHKYNMAKYCSYGINANNDTIITNLNINRYDKSAIKRVEADSNSKKMTVSLSPSHETLRVSLSTGEIPEEILIYAMSGALAKEAKMEREVNVSALAAGVYVVMATDARGNRYNSKFMKR